MTLATTLLASALVVPNMPPPEYDDCEVVTNCVFDASRDDVKVFAVRIGLDATPPSFLFDPADATNDIRVVSIANFHAEFVSPCIGCADLAY